MKRGFEPCDRCDGWGHHLDVECGRCDGTGKFRAPFTNGRMNTFLELLAAVVIAALIFTIVVAVFLAVAL